MRNHARFGRVTATGLPFANIEVARASLPALPPKGGRHTGQVPALPAGGQ
jgi:hypothetical protein